MMGILKCRDHRGLNAMWALVFLTFPTATGPPYPPLQLPLLYLPSLALCLTNPYLPGRIPRRTQEQGSSHRELPHEVIRHAHEPRAGILVPIPSALDGRAATRIRRPRAIDSISRPPVAVSPWRRPSEDPPAPWDRLLLLFVGEEAPISLESIVRFSSVEFEIFLPGRMLRPVHFVLDSCAAPWSANSW